MKNFKYISIFVFIIAIMFSACPNPLDQTILNPELNNGEKVLVNIYIGEEDVRTSARTTSPNESAVAGYQLTFSGGAHAPVNIIGSNQTQIFLGNGNWIISATAYKLGGEIGKTSDAVATGNIIVNISNGQIIGGTVPPIILKSVGTGNGALYYSISIDSGITGTMTLWNISGNTKISGFGNNGDLDLSSIVSDGLANGSFLLATGRYIAEVRLINLGNIAFKREVIEIWQDTFTTFKFEPSLFLDPNAILPNSKAILCETSSNIGDSVIGVGNGSGFTEVDPKTYIFYPTNENVSIMLHLEQNSLFSIVNWVTNTGSIPDEVYPNYGLPSAIISISENNVLWVKVISEDRSETMYYKFIIIPPANYGDFKVAGIDLAGITYVNNILTITTDGTYTIVMKDGVTSTTTNSIAVAERIDANITLSSVNINVSSINNACALDMTGATLNLTLVGNNTLTSGSNRAGLEVPDGATLVITEVSTGSLTARGGSTPSAETFGNGSGGAGIGGSSGKIGGSISILGGTIIANAGYQAAGIGGGSGGAGGIINISSGNVTATGGNSNINVSGGSGGAGIGGGARSASGTINISGGIVTASAGNVNSSTGIGTGTNGTNGFISITGGTITANGNPFGTGTGIGGTSVDINTINGNAVIFASSIQIDHLTNDKLGPTIIFNGVIGTMYGNVSLARNVTIPSGRNLIINNGQTLTIQNGCTLTNNGTIIMYYGGNIIGTITGNQPVAPAFIISGDNSYNYAEGILTITGNGTYTISMREGLTSTTSEKIIVAPDVTANITLSGVNINLSNSANACAFDMAGATVNLTLVGNNTLRSGLGRAGLEVTEGAFLVITGESTGSLTADGYSDPGAATGGAGIGSSSNRRVGTINILGGTINANSGRYNSGIGGHYSDRIGTITIAGGIVTATGENFGISAGAISITGGTIIANGNRGGIVANPINITGGTVTATGYGSGYGIGDYHVSWIANPIANIGSNAVIFASSIQTNLPSGENLGSAIIFDGNIGKMYGNVALARNVTIPSDRVLHINNGQTLIIQSGYALTNNGIITSYAGGNIFGTIIGNQPTTDSPFLISGGSAFTYIGGNLSITGNGTYTIRMRNDITSTTSESIVVNPEVNANITLYNVNINVSSSSNACAFDMTGATVNLTLFGDNFLSSGSNRAGIQIFDGANLTITDTSIGSLTIISNGQSSVL